MVKKFEAFSYKYNFPFCEFAQATYIVNNFLIFADVLLFLFNLIRLLAFQF